MEQVERHEGEERIHFSIILHPHRSLSPRAFLILMGCIAGVSFITGMVFLMMGAWPVLGFFGLDVLAIYIAFKMNFKSGKRYEIVEIRGSDLTVKAVLPNGRSSITVFQAYWSRILLDNNILCVRCRMETLEFGRFLIEEEKAEVKEMITHALYRYRNNAVLH
ncbi:DUF2244 domain-containing protein [Sneathiella sp. P13V-1]|uniref:DUF2244 domain-containing protein n=1 Tax=Sneathiella sp. P13V-1 TaxID=2697366 RepID=UPI00187B3238|nr:DUF2244 domain-containing protein [Sneathiella sp. P13V-1]MBE7635799.1 DUF2244 domain-containing protein [Sneathiella sp. P13V-1]